MHIHKWNYHGKDYKKGKQYRTCEKCNQNETLHHLLHVGFEYYFYDIEQIKPSLEEIQQKERKNYAIISTMMFGAITVIIWLSANKIMFPITVILLLGSFLLGTLLAFRLFWNNFKLYSIPVSSEEHIQSFFPKEKQSYKQTQRESEKILMFRLANNQISKEEYTARMARL